MTYGQCAAITVATTAIAVTLFVNDHGQCSPVCAMIRVGNRVGDDVRIAFVKATAVFSPSVT